MPNRCIDDSGAAIGGNQAADGRYLLPRSVGANGIPEWILHDLRRTAATGMARLKFAPHVVDKILNHVSGTIRGVAAVYNRFEYLEERRRALDSWGRFVVELASPTPADVVLRTA
jgi:hypothetical protein